MLLYFAIYAPYLGIWYCRKIRTFWVNIFSLNSWWCKRKLHYAILRGKSRTPPTHLLPYQSTLYATLCQPTSLTLNIKVSSFQCQNNFNISSTVLSIIILTCNIQVNKVSKNIALRPRSIANHCT